MKEAHEHMKEAHERPSKRIISIYLRSTHTLKDNRHLGLLPREAQNAAMQDAQTTTQEKAIPFPFLHAQELEARL